MLQWHSITDKSMENLFIACKLNPYNSFTLFRKFLHDLKAQRAGCSIPNAVKVLLALRTSKSCGNFLNSV